MMRRALIIILIFILILSSYSIKAQLADSPWPTFRKDTMHSGVSEYDTSHVDGTVKWSFETGDAIESSPVIDSNGTIYVGSHDGYLYAINPDGTEKWRFDAGPPIYDVRWNVNKSIMAAPAIAADGTIYIYSSASYLFAVNPDGTEKWRFYVKWGNDFWSSPVIDLDGTIYVGSARSQEDSNYDGGLVAVNPDGTQKWLFLDDSGVTSTAAIGPDGTIYFGGNVGNPSGPGNIGKVYALNPDGSQIWEFTTETWMESSPIIASDGTIYTGSGTEARMYALNPDGTEKWRFQAEEGLSSVPGIGADGTIYVGSNSGFFYAFNPNGTVKWSYSTEGAGICSSPAIGADGTIYFGAWDKKLYAFGGSEVVVDSDGNETDDIGADDGQNTNNNDSENKDNTNIDSNDETPGFEIMVILLAISLILYFKKKKFC